jgi:hypothetical protein
MLQGAEAPSNRQESRQRGHQQCAQGGGEQECSKSGERRLDVERLASDGDGDQAPRGLSGAFLVGPWWQGNHQQSSLPAIGQRDSLRRSSQRHRSSVELPASERRRAGEDRAIVHPDLEVGGRPPGLEILQGAAFELPGTLRPLLDHVGDGLRVLAEASVELAQQATAKGLVQHDGEGAEREPQHRHQRQGELPLE